MNLIEVINCSNECPPRIVIYLKWLFKYFQEEQPKLFETIKFHNLIKVSLLKNYVTLISRFIFLRSSKQHWSGLIIAWCTNQKCMTCKEVPLFDFFNYPFWDISIWLLNIRIQIRNFRLPALIHQYKNNYVKIVDSRKLLTFPLWLIHVHEIVILNIE